MAVYLAASLHLVKVCAKTLRGHQLLLVRGQMGCKALVYTDNLIPVTPYIAIALH